MNRLDIAVIGAGPVGAAIAALCADAGFAMAVFEARSEPARDARTLALSHASRELLSEAGAWPAANETPITSIHVSQKGGPGRTVITASEQRLPALGYTVPYAALQGALERALARAAVEVRYGRACDTIALDADEVTLRFAGGEEARARFLVLADGGANAAKIPGIGFSVKDYGQAAIVAALHADRPHGGRAYERFTASGPIALLPVAERHALVWTGQEKDVERRLKLDEEAFVAELQREFGDRAGRFVRVAERATFPLNLRTVNSPIAHRSAIVGNAAQALHPIAGQGLNLGLRDAATLAELLRRTPREALGSPAMLDEYRAARRRDASRGIAFTDFLVSAFADARRLPTWGRGLGLVALDLFPPARRLLAERMIHGAPAP